MAGWPRTRKKSTGLSDTGGLEWRRGGGHREVHKRLRFLNHILMPTGKHPATEETPKNGADEMTGQLMLARKWNDGQMNGVAAGADSEAAHASSGMDTHFPRQPSRGRL